MYVQNTPECLRDRDDPGTGFVVTGGFAQQLVDGLVSKANEISEQLAPEHEKGRSILGIVKVHKQWPTFSKSSSLSKAAKAAARFASQDGQMPLCLQLSVSSSSTSHVSHLSLANPPSATPQSR